MQIDVERRNLQDVLANGFGPSIELVIPETEKSTSWAGSLKIRCGTGKSGGDEGKNYQSEIIGNA